MITTHRACPLSPGCGCQAVCRGRDTARPVYRNPDAYEAAYARFGLWLCGLVSVTFLAGFVAGRI